MALKLSQSRSSPSPRSPCDCSPARHRTHDRLRSSPGLVRARKLEQHYAVGLRKIAGHVGEFVKTWALDNPDLDLNDVTGLQAMLGRYAEVLTPWAQATAKRIGEEIAIKERGGWAEHAELMSRAMRRELNDAPTGQVLRAFMAEQVRLIKSLPTEAGQRVHNLVIENLSTSGRPSEIADAIMRSGEVTKSRATLIARTEISRTASALTMTRAMHVGSTAYAWRTSDDSDVRPSHAKMEGRAVDWDKPPTLDGLTGHAGMLPNCRCWPDPILPELD